jgi:hypothetical protein
MLAPSSQPPWRCEMNKMTSMTMAALVMASAYATAKVIVTA